MLQRQVGKSMNTDSLSDFLTRIRNGSKAKRASVSAPFSKLIEQVALLLKAEGFVGDVSVLDIGKGKRDLSVKLRYDEVGAPIIDFIGRVSKPGHRIYSRRPEGKSVRAGLGVTILSTPLGVLSDLQAKEKNVGGEVLAQVW